MSVNDILLMQIHIDETEGRMHWSVIALDLLCADFACYIRLD